MRYAVLLDLLLGRLAGVLGVALGLFLRSFFLGYTMIWISRTDGIIVSSELIFGGVVFVERRAELVVVILC